MFRVNVFKVAYWAESYAVIRNCTNYRRCSTSGDNNSVNATLNQRVSSVDKSCNVEFTGHIPLDDLQIAYCRSSGPGGQNVNKVNTKVEIRFHIDTAKWLPQAVKTKLFERETGRITKDGYLVVKSERTRRQLLNQADCMDRLRSIIFEAANDKPFEPTAEQLAVIQARFQKAKLATLREKRKQSQVKRHRQASPGE